MSLIRYALNRLRLKSKNQYVRARAATALGRSGRSDVPERLLKLLEADESEYVRGQAARALGEMRESRAFEPLLKELQQEGLGIQHAAAEALGLLQDHRAVMPLVQMLQNPQSGTALRCAAADALGDLADSRAVEPLIAALAIARTPAGPQSALPVADHGQASAEEAVRMCALRALTRMPDVRVVTPLNRMVGESRPYDPLDASSYSHDFLYTCIRLIEEILVRQADAVSADELQELARREETVVLSRWEPKWDEEPEWRLSCATVRQLALQELKRRQLSG